MPGMVMLEDVIARFTIALGRDPSWGFRRHDESGLDRLRLLPHYGCEPNAYYEKEYGEIRFGYFAADETPGPGSLPRGTIYTCLSHDIIAHEMAHALLDGMRSNFAKPTNPDVLAFHEAFADIVALMQHFTIPQILENEINRTKGDLESESMLGSLAVQFGRAIGGRGALRDAIGTLNDERVWTRHQPDPTEYHTTLAPHARGAKESACGCAGVFSAPAAIELYARAFEEAGALARLESFASFNGADFYRLPRNRGRITLERRPWTVAASLPFGPSEVVPMCAGETLAWRLRGCA